MSKTTCTSADFSRENGERVTVKMSCNTDYVCGHTASVFGWYFTLTYTAYSDRTNKCVSVTGDGISCAVLHWRARTWFADWRSNPNHLVFFRTCIKVCRVVSCRHIDALYSFLYMRRKWLILRNSMKLISCSMYHNLYRLILNYWKNFCACSINIGCKVWNSPHFSLSWKIGLNHKASLVL